MTKKPLEIKNKKLMLYSTAMGSGKTYLADYLVQNYGFTKYSLATPLKQYTHNYLEDNGIDYNESKKDEELEDKNGNLLGKSLRDYYILFGEDAKAKWGQDHWVNLLLNRMIGDDLIVIDDLRTPLEKELLEKQGFVPVFVDSLIPPPDNKMEGLLFNTDKPNLLFPFIILKGDKANKVCNTLNGMFHKVRHDLYFPNWVFSYINELSTPLPIFGRIKQYFADLLVGNLLMGTNVLCINNVSYKERLNSLALLAVVLESLKNLLSESKQKHLYKSFEKDFFDVYKFWFLSFVKPRDFSLPRVGLWLWESMDKLDRGV